MDCWNILFKFFISIDSLDESTLPILEILKLHFGILFTIFESFLLPVKFINLDEIIFLVFLFVKLFFSSLSIMFII